MNNARFGIKLCNIGGQILPPAMALQTHFLKYRFLIWLFESPIIFLNKSNSRKCELKWLSWEIQSNDKLLCSHGEKKKAE